MKSRLLTIALICMIMVVVATPVFAVSSSFDFTISQRVVDGSKNGQYHKLNKGKAKISNAYVYQVAAKRGATSPQTLYVDLINKTTGNYFGTITIGKPTKDGKAKYFSGTFSKSVGGGSKYYLYVHRDASDGRTIYGNGKISN